MFRDLRCSGGRLTTFLLLSALLSCSLLPGLSFAAEVKDDNKNLSSNKQSSNKQSSNNLPFDVRIIIDISGSMRQTDPNNLRIPALNLLLELMPEGAQGGIWTFGRYVNNLVPVAKVDEQWREQAKQSAIKITSLGLKTNLTGALNDAAWGLKADSGFQQSIILLTDGKVDMAENNDPESEKVNSLERQKLMAKVLQKYRDAGANVHTLALSDLADKNLLQQIALETDGLYSQAENAEELMKAFLRAFDRAVPVEQVPMEDNTFVIDGSVDEFTALIFKRAGSGQETALLTPEGGRFTELDHPENVRWHKDLGFDLITIKQPDAGTWVAEADLDSSNRVTILSALALSVEGIPTTIFPGDKLDVEIKLTNEGQVVEKAEILRLTDMTMKVITASGREGSKVLSDPENPPSDGVYREGLYRLKELGSYQIDVIAEGRTFQRKRSFAMTMIQPVEITHKADEEKGVYRIEVKSLSDNLDIERSRVIAKIKSPDENTIIQSVVYDPQVQAWVSEIEPSKGPGEYSVALNVRGITQSGKNFKVKPEPIVFNLPIITAGSSEAELAEGVDEAVVSEPVVSEPVVSEAVVDSVEEVPNAETAESEPELKEPPVEKPIEEPVEEVVPDEAAALDAIEGVEEIDEGLAWWIYLILVLLNVAVIGAGVWWFMFRKTNTTVDAQTSMDKDETLADLESLEEDFAGDFDSLDEGDEEEIPQMSGADVSSTSPDTEAPSADSFDEDFSIDPDDDVDTDEDSWGEFDSDKKE